MATKKWATSLIGVLAAACGDAVSVGNDVTKTAITASLSQIAAVAAVEVTRVRVVVGLVKLEKAGVDNTEDFLSEQSFVVEGTVSGGVASALVMLDAPAGTYKEIEVSIDKLEPGKPSEAALIAEHPDLAEASIAIEGNTFENGLPQPFLFTAALDRDMEALFDPFLVLTGPAETTLALDTSGWFLDALGNLLDPRDAANRSVIEANIQRSIEAFLSGL